MCTLCLQHFSDGLATFHVPNSHVWLRLAYWTASIPQLLCKLLQIPHWLVRAFGPTDWNTKRSKKVDATHYQEWCWEEELDALINLSVSSTRTSTTHIHWSSIHLQCQQWHNSQTFLGASAFCFKGHRIGGLENWDSPQGLNGVRNKSRFLGLWITLCSTEHRTMGNRDPTCLLINFSVDMFVGAQGRSCSCPGMMEVLDRAAVDTARLPRSTSQ